MDEMGCSPFFSEEEGPPPHAVLAAGTIPVSSLISFFTKAQKETPQALRIILGPISDEVVRELSPICPNHGLVDGWLDWPLDENRFRLALSLVQPFPKGSIGSGGQTPGIVANSASLRVIRQLRQEMESMRESLNHCSLTGLLNRRGIEEKLGLDWQACEGLGLEFALLMIDVDYFKAVNDQYLHPAGDQVLVELGKHLSLQLRAGDSLGRMGEKNFGFWPQIRIPKVLGSLPKGFANRWAKNHLPLARCLFPLPSAWGSRCFNPTSKQTQVSCIIKPPWPSVKQSRMVEIV